MRRQLRAVLALGISAGALGLMAAPAWAHDQLLSSSPSAEEVLEESPEDIRLEFSGSGLTTGDGVTNELRVVGDAGSDHAGETSVEGSTMSAPVSEPLDEGDYEIQYRVVYADGHAEESSIPFSVETAEGGAQNASGADEAAGPADGTASEGGADMAEEVQEPENRTESRSALLPIVFGVGGLGVVVLGVVLVRQKIRQAESWKRGDQDGRPGAEGGRSGDGPDGGRPDRGDSGSGPGTR